MNTQMFLENFGQITNAPGGVKRLREMILHYAVSGNLVTQIDSEGNAEQDIEKANFLRQEFQQRFKSRHRKPTGSPRDEEIPFPIPTNWNWVRMESIACYIQRGKGPTYAASGQALVVSQKCIQWSGFDLTPARRISDESLRQYGEERFLMNGDILWNSTGTGTAGRVAIYTGNQEPVVADSHVTIIRLTNFIPQYIWCYLASTTIQARMAPNQEGSMVSGTTNQIELSISKVAELPVPCPPVEEQKRIVAKVDELMALCDKLEVQQQERERRFPVLSRACHARFVESPSLVNLKAIFGEVGSVSPEELRKTILTLAVQGKLVPQDLGEESAEEILKRSKIKTSPVEQMERRHLIPPRWHWIYFRSTGDQRLGKMLDKAKNRGINKPYLRNTNVQWNQFELDDLKQMRIEPEEEDELCLKSGDLLICEGGEPGRCAIWRSEQEEMYFQKALHRVRAFQGIVPEYLAINLNLDCRNGVLSNYFTGATIKHLTGQSLAKYPIPLPPTSEQHRIVAKVDQLMTLIDKLEEQQARKAKVAEAFAQAAVAAITGTEIKEPEKMKALKTELVSRLQTKNTPNAADPAPLTKLLTEHNGELPAKALWQRSGLEIDAFYQQLRTEMANGWIIEPEKAVMKEIEAD